MESVSAQVVWTKLLTWCILTLACRKLECSLVVWAINVNLMCCWCRASSYGWKLIVLNCVECGSFLPHVMKKAWLWLKMSHRSISIDNKDRQTSSVIPVSVAYVGRKMLGWLDILTGGIVGVLEGNRLPHLNWARPRSVAETGELGGFDW